MGGLLTGGPKHAKKLFSGNKSAVAKLGGGLFHKDGSLPSKIKGSAGSEKKARAGVSERSLLDVNK